MPSSSLVTRIAVLVVVVVFFQIGVVSEVPVFGVAIDLSPLLVAFVGLLCGSTIGAVTGFAVLHTVTLAMKGRTLWLGCVYAIVAGFAWALLAIALLGLADSAFGLRQRYLRGRPPLPES